VYAVKRSRHSLETEGEREVAMREVFALAALQGCPQLVRYLGAWMEEKHLYIQTEFCPGGSLERAVFPRGGAGAGGPAFGGAGAPYPPPAQQQQQQQQQDGDGAASSGFDESEEALLRVARDAASALQFMHARGIVHMDVKVRKVKAGAGRFHPPPIVSACNGTNALTVLPPFLPSLSSQTQPGNILLAGDGSFKLGDLGHAIKADGSMVVAEGDERYLSMDVLKVRPSVRPSLPFLSPPPSPLPRQSRPSIHLTTTAHAPSLFHPTYRAWTSSSSRRARRCQTTRPSSGPTTSSASAPPCELLLAWPCVRPS